MMQLEKATELVTKLWFPFNPSILNSVMGKLETGDFSHIKGQIVNELEKDMSLFLLCLKELVTILDERGVGSYREGEISTYEFFSQVSKEELDLALSRVAKFKCHQKLDSGSRLQKQKLVEMYISGVAVKTLSEKMNEGELDSVSRELNYSSILLRQLGATLIAWNYPQIYEKVASRKHTPDSFDDGLRDALGFSPIMLGFSIAKSWNLPPVYLRVVGGDQAFEDFRMTETFTVQDRIISDSVIQICEIGEALSRAMNPDLFSSSVTDLDKASKYIRKVIGEQGVREILDAAKNQLDHLKFGSLSEMIDESTSSLVKKVSSAKYSNQLASKNIYLDALPEALHEKVLTLYSEMTPEGSVPVYTAAFAKQIVPSTVFSSLIVYLNDPFKQLLFPSLVIGTPRAITPTAVGMSGTGNSYNIISAGFGLKTPLREDRLIRENEEIVMLASALGSDPAIGVLYAEADISDPEFPSSIMRYFKALKNLLSDCLHLESSEV
jgi:hypothetical protein